MKAVLISCFDWYEMRLKYVEKKLKNKGYDVIYYTSNFDHLRKEKIYNESNKHVHYVDVPKYNKNLSIKRLESHYKFGQKMYKELLKEKPDFIYCLIPPNSLASFMSRYKKLYKCKLLFDIIDLWPESLPTKVNKNISVFNLWRLLRDNNLKYADYIITECDLYHEILKSQIRDIKSKTVYLAKENFDLLSSPILREDVIQLCYIGSINNIIDIKKIKELIDEINKRKPVVLHIIGDGEKREELINEIKTTGAKIEYHGKIYELYKKQEIFNKCQFGLNIMKDTVCVGLTMKSIDYFQAGLPIINNIQYDTAKIVDQYNIGYNIINEDISKVADIISSINISDILKMRENTKIIFNNLFSIDSLNKRINEIFEEL